MNLKILELINKTEIKTLLYFTLYIFIINIIGFLAMYMDKKKAIKQNYRISEKFIFFVSLILGSIGVYIGMYKFRHKTRHSSFTIGIPILLIINILCIIYIIKDLIF